MARSIIIPQLTSRVAIGVGASGTEFTGESAFDHAMPNDGNTLLLVRNNSATETRYLEVVMQKSIDGEAVGPKQYEIVGTQHIVLGPFRSDVYNNTHGQVEINVDNSDLRMQAFSLGGV